MSWLERLGMFRKAPPVTLPQAATLPERDIQAFVPPVGRLSWGFGPNLALNPFFFIPQHQNLRLYEQLVETVPVLNAALSRIVQLVGCPEIKTEDATVEADIRQWRDNLKVNQIQTGFENWFSTWVMDHLLYGRAHAELILTAGKRDIYAIQELHTRTIELRPREGYGVRIVQQQFTTGNLVELNPLLVLTAVHDVRTDSPQGNSLLYGLAFVSEIYTKLLTSLKQTWERFGAPSFVVIYKPPVGAQGLSDPTGARGQAYASSIASGITTLMKSRAEGDIRDIAAVGDISVQVLGAEGEALDIEVPGRHLVEQIVAKTGLPPMLLGLQWQTTERMSQVLAGLLSSLIDKIRKGMEAEIRYLFELRQRLVGRPVDFTITWEAPTLVDAYETAHADLEAAQAQGQKMKNLERLWTLGALSPVEYVREVRPEFEDLDDAEIKRRLPQLVDIPPAPPSPFAGMGAGQGGTSPLGTNLPFGRGVHEGNGNREPAAR